MSVSLGDLQGAFARVCFAAEPSEEDLARLHGDRERWLLYRRMVRSRLTGMIRLGLPKTAELVRKTVFDRSVDRYLAEHGPRTRFIREVVHEFVDWTLPAWEADPELPSHTCELARYEDLKWRVASIEWSLRDEDVREFDFEAPCVVNPTARAITGRHRVDRDAVAPAVLSQRHYFVVFRRPNDARIQTYVLNEIGGRLFAAWSRGCSGAEGARQVLAELGRPADARFVDGMAGVLADLLEQKVLLGSRA